MATYAIGDVQGCYDELCDLLERLHFDPTRDHLWFLGDLINRGRANLEVLRLVMSLGSGATTVLGNHDLHFLAIVLGGHSPTRADTFQDALAAPDVGEIVLWYRRQPLLVKNELLGYVMTHAGIPHIWDLGQAEQLAAEVELVIRDESDNRYFCELYGNVPAGWSDTLEGMDRWRAITNYFTRMRLMDTTGTLDFSHKGGLADAPGGLLPWYELRAGKPIGLKLLFGHWAAIEGLTGRGDIIALDTGCVWGRELTALCLETGRFESTPAR